MLNSVFADADDCNYQTTHIKGPRNHPQYFFNVSCKHPHQNQNAVTIINAKCSGAMHRSSATKPRKHPGISSTPCSLWCGECAFGDVTNCRCCWLVKQGNTTAGKVCKQLCVPSPLSHCVAHLCLLANCTGRTGARGFFNMPCHHTEPLCW